MHTLEVFQTFFEIINEKPRKIAKVEKNILDFCPTGQSLNQHYQPVVTLVQVDSSTNQPYYHTAFLKEYLNENGSLILTVINSLSQTGESVIQDKDK